MRRKLGWGLGALAVALGISGATTLWAQSGRVVSTPPPAKDKYAPTQWSRPGAKRTAPSPKPVTPNNIGKRTGFATMSASEAEALIAPDPRPTAKQPPGGGLPPSKETSPPPLSESLNLPTPPHAPVPVSPVLPEPPAGASDPPATIRLPEAPELSPPGDITPAPKDPVRLPEAPALLPLKDQIVAPTAIVTPSTVVTPATVGTAARIPGEPYVTSGLMFLPDEQTIRPVTHTVPAARPTLPQTAPSAPAAPASQSTSFLQDQLKRLIERSLGPGARQVQVVFPAPNHVRIRFMVRSEQEAPALVSRVREMPELASFTIDDVEVMLPE